MKGLIFNVKRYSVHDGPGIRVTFFMKGCPLSCIWCHNPEGISPEPETVQQVNRIGEREFRVTEEAGKFMTVNEILEILKKEQIFIEKSGGGVTFSGGEPMMQAEFLLEALKKCRANGYHTAVDTSGYCHPENIKSILPFTDLFLFDIKHMDETRHIELTGVSNSLIMSNFRIIVESGKDIMIRIPVIPGLNDDLKNFEEIKKLIMMDGNKNIRRISLLPYHKTGTSKYKKFNLPYYMDDIKPPAKERMDELKKFFSETNIKVKIGS